MAILLASPAAAQDARWELSAAYDFTRDWTGDINFPMGWNVGGAYAITPWLSAAGEVGASRKNIPIAGDDVHLNLQTYLAGLRARRPAGRLIEFGQVLAGAADASGEVFGVTSGSTHFAVQAGAGLDYGLSRRLSARAQIDFRIVHGGDQVDSAHQARFGVGVAYAFR
jgi:Outer membrane protein beta-barrel domain